MADHCTGPDCAKPATHAGGTLCEAHARQLSRGGELRPLRAGDAEVKVSFRCAADLKSDVERAAKRDGIDPAEWWRQAGREKLK